MVTENAILWQSAGREGVDMAIFIVSYDIAEGNDYESLWQELDNLGGHKAQLSCYLVKQSGSAQSLRDQLSKFVDDNDKLMVAETKCGDIAFTKAFKGTNDWLSDNC